MWCHRPVQASRLLVVDPHAMCSFSIYIMPCGVSCNPHPKTVLKSACCPLLMH